jgi:hypothetical protein
MKNIEVSGELDMEEQSYDDLTFLIKTGFFPVAHVGAQNGHLSERPLQAGHAKKQRSKTYRLT